MVDLKKLRPFKLFIKTNFPFIESTFEALDNYGLLCKIVEYLNEVIKNENDVTSNFNELLNTFNQMLEDIQNEFNQINDNIDSLDDKIDEEVSRLDDKIDNLDLQEYINIRLDELVDSGELDNILEAFLGAQKIYSTFQDVITDASNLASNQKIKTFGYNSINDGGEGEYIIVTEKNTTDFYIDLSESLFARLILKNNEINVNALGVDNTGQTDSSTLLNSIISKINTNWLANKFDVNTILLNGTYLFENQIKLSPFVKLRGTGYVTILTDVSNDSAIHISYLENVSNPSNFAGNKLDWNYAELINFEKGGIIKNIDGELQNTCIEIGTRSDWGEYKAISRYLLKNFRICNYNIGILHNRYHVYIGKYENISFETNTIGVQYGTQASQQVTDSGENMSYLNCLFSSGTNAVKWFTDGFDSSFELCSFDFITDVFYDLSNLGYKRISCNQCHFEGYKNSIMNTLKTYSMLIITNSSIVDNDSREKRIIPFKEIQSPIVFENNKYIVPISTTSDPEKLYFDIGQKIKMSNFQGVENTWIGFLKDNNLLGNVFDYITDGTYTNTTGAADSQFKNWKFDYNASIISNQFEIETDNYIYTGHKSLILRSNSEATTSKTIVLVTDYIDVSNYSYIFINDFTYNMKRISSNYEVKMYDGNKNLIGTKNPYHSMSPLAPTESNQWYSSGFGASMTISTNCKYITLQIGYGNINHSDADPVGTQYKIGGICINGF